MQNADFFQLARRVYGYKGADVYESKTNNNKSTPTALVITCSIKDYHHALGLVVGNKEFAGPEWGRHYQIVPWKKGVYFWESNREHSVR